VDNWRIDGGSFTDAVGRYGWSGQWALDASLGALMGYGAGRFKVVQDIAGKGATLFNTLAYGGISVAGGLADRGAAHVDITIRGYKIQDSFQNYNGQHSLGEQLVVDTLYGLGAGYMITSAGQWVYSTTFGVKESNRAFNEIPKMGKRTWLVKGIDKAADISEKILDKGFGISGKPYSEALLGAMEKDGSVVGKIYQRCRRTCRNKYRKNDRLGRRSRVWIVSFGPQPDRRARQDQKLANRHK